jgi:hypothetical protein
MVARQKDQRSPEGALLQKTGTCYGDRRLQGLSSLLKEAVGFRGHTQKGVTT